MAWDTYQQPEEQQIGAEELIKARRDKTVKLKEVFHWHPGIGFTPILKVSIPQGTDRMPIELTYPIES